MEESQDESQDEIEAWESDHDTPVDPDSSVESIIMVDTSLPVRQQPPQLPQTPLRRCPVSPINVGRRVGSPMYRVTRSRAARS